MITQLTRLLALTILVLGAAAVQAQATPPAPVAATESTQAPAPTAASATEQSAPAAAAGETTTPPAPTEPQLVGVDKISAGDTAWMLTSTALVLMMTIPGLALFYGGMVRKKNVLATLMQSFAITCVVTMLWWLIGYSWAFTPGGSPYLGGELALPHAWHGFHEGCEQANGLASGIDDP